MKTSIVIFALCLTACSALPQRKIHGKSFAPRIINGAAATLGQFPWQAGLFVTTASISKFCGGSLISKNFVLTAGHCVKDGVSGHIATGTLNARNGTETQIDKFILHEDYDENILANDIGLLKLATPVKLDDNTKLISFKTGDLDAGVDVTVSGWGLTRDDGTAISDQLNFINLVTITNKECATSYGVIRDEVVCAVPTSDGIKSTCNGDSGGALVINADSDSPTQVAVVSFVSDDGCSSGAPSGYTRVGTYQDWINDKLSSE